MQGHTAFSPSRRPLDFSLWCEKLKWTALRGFPLQFSHFPGYPAPGPSYRKKCPFPPVVQSHHLHPPLHLSYRGKSGQCCREIAANLASPHGEWAWARKGCSTCRWKHRYTGKGFGCCWSPSFVRIFNMSLFFKEQIGRYTLFYVNRNLFFTPGMINSFLGRPGDLVLSTDLHLEC